MERERKNPYLQKVNRSTLEAIKGDGCGRGIRFLSTFRFPLRFTEVYKNIFKRHDIRGWREKEINDMRLELRNQTSPHLGILSRLLMFVDWQSEKRREKVGMGSRGEAGSEKHRSESCA